MSLAYSVDFMRNWLTEATSQIVSGLMKPGMWLLMQWNLLYWRKLYSVFRASVTTVVLRTMIFLLTGTMA